MENLNTNTNNWQGILSEFIEKQIISCHTALVNDLLNNNLIGLEDIQNLYNDSEHDECKEIFEYYQVTEWFYHKLDQHNEPVINTNYGYFWGRTCSGQSIILDRVIMHIYNSK
jgi:hypothetical protein